MGLNSRDIILALEHLHPEGYVWPSGYAGPIPGANYTEFVAAYGDDAPSEKEISSARDKAIAHRESIAALREARDELRQWWRSDDVPTYVRGPFQEKFDAAGRLLDSGDTESAAALIQYAEPPLGYGVKERKCFDRVKKHLVSALEEMSA